MAPRGSIHDQLATGTKIRILTIVDATSRFSPAIVPRFSFRAPDVIEVLERVGREIGLPKTIRVDLGSEFISRDLDLWAYQRDVTLDFSRPGKPTDRARVRHRSEDRAEGVHREPERQVPGRVPEHALVHEPLRCGPKMRGSGRRDYNEVRPHSAIGNKVPIELTDRSAVHGPR